MRFDGKIALVTGSSRGIGQAITLRLAQEGADVLVNYRVQAERAKETLERVQGMGRRAVVVQANVGNPEDIQRMFDVLAQEFGGLDFLVCNAGGAIPEPLMETSIKRWDLAMNVNARAYLLCAQAAFPLMKGRGGGRIVAVTAPTNRAFPQYGPMAAAKAAMNTMTAYLAAELGPHGINVNAVAPAVVDTDVVKYYQAGADAVRLAREKSPSRQVTSPEDVAGLVAYLCSSDANQITGQVLAIDGGMLLPLYF